MKLSHLILCMILIVGAIFSGMFLYERNLKQSEIVGYYESTKSTLFECHAKSITFDNNDGVYTFSTEWNDTFDYDGEIHSYDLYVNKAICSIVDDGAGYLNAQLDMSFYATNGEEKMRDTLYINIDFYSSKTVLTVTTEGDNTAMSYWVEYVNSYGFNLKVTQLDMEGAA